MNIRFYKFHDLQLISYHRFVMNVSNNDFLELNGYKTRNILSIVFNHKTRDLVLDELFSANGNFLSSETKNNLLTHLSPEDALEIRQDLQNYLECQIQSDWLKYVSAILNEEKVNTILIPTPVLNHTLILNQLQTLFPKKKFVDWRGYDEEKKIVILDYNHIWKKRNIFTLEDSKFSACFLKHFFEDSFNWKLYNDDKRSFAAFCTPTRIALFGNDVINELKLTLASMRPANEASDFTKMLDESHNLQYNQYSRDEIKIHFENQKTKNYALSSSFFLVENGKYEIEDAYTLLESCSKYEGAYSVANLENIILNIDVSKIIEAIEKDEAIYYIVQPLWVKFNLSEDDGSLWKQLLARKSKELGVNVVFKEIERLYGTNNFVSQNTFEGTYCNPKSTTIIPREKRVFKAICQYLELPIEYRAAVQRERNLVGSYSEELRGKLKALIKSMVECKVFDEQRDDDSLLEVLNVSIEKIEKDVDIDFFGSTREALIYSSIAIYYEIIEKIKLKPIVKIELSLAN